MWGLIMQSVQLFKTAVLLIFFWLGSPPKKKSTSLVADYTESLPWTAFFVPSVPKRALIEFGASALAFSVLVGPINYLHPFMASLETSSIPTTTSLVIND
jgi:hypothetical protein